MENFRNQILIIIITGIITCIGAVVLTNFKFIEQVDSRIKSIEDKVISTEKKIDNLENRQFELLNK